MLLMRAKLTPKSLTPFAQRVSDLRRRGAGLLSYADPLGQSQHGDCLKQNRTRLGMLTGQLPCEVMWSITSSSSWVGEKST
jgi:hypothetical protein